MKDAWLSRLFLRFRDQRDGKALAAVFDATARELIEVAAHLVPELHEAEDVVQTTFQRMIERAATFDGERGLRAWMYGILWREAAKSRRGAVQRVEHAVHEGRATTEPLDELAASELPTVVRRTIERIPSPYREVLQPVLCEERSTREVARSLGRSPGTVRVQLQRGLERLRKRLGSSLHGGVAPAVLAALHGRHGGGLDALRAQVLGHARIPAGAVPVASSLFLGAQIASVAPTLSALVGAALVLALGTGTIVLRSAYDATGIEAIHSAAAISAAAQAEESAEPSARLVAGIEQQAGDATDRRVEPAPHNEVAQIRGIVLDPTGAPLPDAVALARTDDEDGLRRMHRTGADGRFAFGGLPLGDWYVSVDDPRFARMWWRKYRARVPETPEEIEEVRLQLYAPHHVEGVVVDSAGEGVAGVRVTLAIEWIAGEEHPVQGHLTHEITSACTDERGAFALDRLSPGRMTVVLDHPAFARTIADFEVPGDPPRLTIERGLFLDGRVVHAGAPLPKIRAVAEATSEAHLSMGRWELVTDEAGRFRVERIPSFRHVTSHGVPTLEVRVEDSLWTSDRYRIFESEEGLPPVTIEARRNDDAAGEPRSIDVGRDLAAEAETRGEPVGTGAIRVRVEGDLAGQEPPQVYLWGRSPGIEHVTRDDRLGEALSSVFDSLPAGTYRIWVRGRQGARSYVPEIVELADGALQEVILRPGPATLRGTIRCAGSPVHAESILCRQTHSSIDHSAFGSAAADGGYQVEDLVPGSYELLVSCEGAIRQSYDVTVGDDDTWFDVELPPGRIEGRLVGVERKPMHDPWERVFVFPFGWSQEAGNLGAYAEVDGANRFVARYLPPGDYVLSFHAAVRHVPTRVVTITATDSVQQVDLSPTALPGMVKGRITNLPTRTGKAEAWIVLLRRDHHGVRMEDFCVLDEQAGTFHFEELEDGDYALLVNEQPKDFLLWVPHVDVSPNATTDLALTVPPCRPVSIVLDAGESWTPRAIWKLRMPSGDWLWYLRFLGSGSEGRYASSTPFALPYGAYAVEADFGDPTPVVREFTLEPGEGVVEIVVERP